MASTAPLAPAKRPGRVEWLDGYRGAAVLAMIEAHVVNTFLAPTLREAAWFGWLNWFNGLVAPAFLFIAGWAQGLNWYAKPGRPVAFGRKAKRLLEIAALGYALHFPWTELGQRRWAEALRVGTQVDVLPCLAAALLAVLGVQWLAQRGREKGRAWIYFALLGVLATGAVWLAPAALAWSAGPVSVVAFVNQTTGSLFPLLPWTAFVFAGALLGALRGLPVWVLLGVWAVVRLLAWLLADNPFSTTSPAFFCERLAWVAAFAALCQWVAQVWQPDALLFAGRESLVMYAGHLLIIGWIAQAGVLGGGLGWSAVAGMYAAVLAATWAIALAWTKWKGLRSAKAR